MAAVKSTTSPKDSSPTPSSSIAGIFLSTGGNFQNSQPSRPTTQLHQLQQPCLAEKLQLSNNQQDICKNVRVIGHRGALFEAVENTLESFQKCIEMGCDGIELDVFLLKDGSLVVFHGTGTDKNPGLLESYCIADDNMDSTEYRNETILDMSYKETQQLKFDPDSHHLPAPVQHIESAKIPTLQQVLRLVKGTKVQVMIELKGEGTVEPSLQCVQDLDMLSQVVFSSFRHERIRRVKELRPRDDISTAAIFSAHVPDNFVEIATGLQADEIHLRYDTCSCERIKAAQAAGFRTMAWFRGPKALGEDILQWKDIQTEREAYEKVLKTGVGAVCCNRPDVVLELLQRNPSYRDE